MTIHHSSTQRETISGHHDNMIYQVYSYILMFLHLVEEMKEEHIEARKEPTAIPTVIELEPEPVTIAHTEATPSASVPLNSIASVTSENTPKVDLPPVKRKR